MIKKILYALLGVLIVIQFLQIDKSPERIGIDPAVDFISMTDPDAEITSILRTSCYDCHSDSTTYPWYTYIQPVGWWTQDHVSHGKRHLNFSSWGAYSQKKADHKMDEAYEMVSEEEMPLPSYLWMHGEAELTAAQREKLAVFFSRQISAGQQAEEGHDEDD